MRQRIKKASGYSLIELAFAAGIILTIGATAVPQTVSSIDAYRAAAAARISPVDCNAFEWKLSRDRRRSR